MLFRGLIRIKVGIFSTTGQIRLRFNTVPYVTPGMQLSEFYTYVGQNVIHAHY